MTVLQWSTTPASNATVNDATYGNIDWAENMSPSNVNDSARSMMAQVRAWYNALLPFEALAVDDTQGADDANKVLGVDASGGAKTVTLPAAASIAGRVYTVIKTDSSANTVTVDANGAEAINGATGVVLWSQYDAVMLVCIGTNGDGSNEWLMLQDMRRGPFFMASRTTTAFATATSIIVFDNEVSDVGAGYDHTTGIFTAPCSGLYRFDASLRTTSAKTISASLRKNSAAGGYALYSLTPLESVSTSIVAEMAATDTMEVYLISGSVEPDGSYINSYFAGSRIR